LERYPAVSYSPDMGPEFCNGVWTVDCNSWTQFEERMEKFKKYKYLWRGQSCDDPLRPNIYRDSAPDERTIEEHLSRFRKVAQWGDALEQFLEQAKGTPEYEGALSTYYEMVCPKRVDHHDPKEIEEHFIHDIFWAIGQHYGLRTPLLDWTQDPYRALFFAFCSRKEGTGKRVVFGLAEKSRRLLEIGQRPAKRYLELLIDLAFVPKILDSSGSPPVGKEIIRPMFCRIEAQKGIFTRSRARDDVEKVARRCYPNFQKEGDIVFLVKLLLPNGVRHDFLRELERRGITYKTMFPDVYGPDLSGTVSYCNVKLELSS